MHTSYDTSNLTEQFDGKSSFSGPFCQVSTNRDSCKLGAKYASYKSENISKKIRVHGRGIKFACTRIYECSLYPHKKHCFFKDLLKVHKYMYLTHVSDSSLIYNIQNLTLTDLGSKGVHKLL